MIMMYGDDDELMMMMMGGRTRKQPKKSVVNDDDLNETKTWRKSRLNETTGCANERAKRTKQNQGFVVIFREVFPLSLLSLSLH